MSTSESHSGQEEGSGKNIVLCFDGTCENFGPNPITNVLKIFQLLETQDDKIQMCYYQPGVGTEANFDPVVDMRRNFSTASIMNKIDALFASSIDHHIVSGYLFLMNYYEKGDKVYMFGFSRGAYVARALAGMLERVGLLNRGLDDMVSMAWKIYESWEFAEQPSESSYNTTLAEEFKRTFSRPYEIRVFFQGLFDSVNSVGILRDRLFPCTQRSGIVDHIRHAVSLDERKGKFKQQTFAINLDAPKLFSLNYNSYLVETASEVSEEQTLDDTNPNLSHSLIELMLNKGSGSVKQASDSSESNSSAKAENLTQKINKQLQKLRSSNLQNTKNVNENVEGFFEYEPFSNSVRTVNSLMTSDLVEKWFPGDHSDVGGGYHSDCETREVLSGLSLRWMIAEAVKHGLIFKKHSIHKLASKQTSLGSLFSTIHDKLSFNQVRHPDLDEPYEQIEDNNTDSREQLLSELESANWLQTTWNNFKEMRINEILTEREAAREKYTFDCTSASKFQIALWWLLELIPIGLRMESGSGKWRSVYIPNLGQPRYVPDYGNIHWSVYWRIRYDNSYRPKNLPNYCRKLLKGYADINMEPSKGRSAHAIASPIKSYPTDLDHRSNNNLPSDNNNSTSTNGREMNKMIVNDIAEVQCFETGVKFSEWAAHHWREIPDDLEPWLLKFPDL
ncbi:hypothetical protein ZYGR_0P01260 [Zygosaccharomyces rouxii]|uniref:ZYRO0E03168p n=2 Tax=Zygosaccharomyces rouxii TaxID=4956 RepID=C5E463_ZYGRC|nr:uncharacterized protein ZYRO0E03168g [Zygosaccharomyces rouxii]KAH9198317.1 hypothetical protein LQ764DRAFT_157567 [Zygosaccharomyces rouxii]GAV49482.1 hypothetical protein ZYGR_0P01260 [Zygosaccharomyces rouxii]CAR30824.1 ZYRO0E03168p [Zygosaccharomyces rouxii]